MLVLSPPPDEGGNAPLVHSVATSQTTTSTSYTDLTTSGPAVTVTVPSSGIIVVIMSVDVSNSNATTTRVGFALSGANTAAAADTSAIRYEEAINFVNTAVAVIPVTGLTPGSTTVTMKYKVASGTGTFVNRRLTVLS